VGAITATVACAACSSTPEAPLPDVSALRASEGSARLGNGEELTFLLVTTEAAREEQARDLEAWPAERSELSERLVEDRDGDGCRDLWIGIDGHSLNVRSSDGVVIHFSR
jgi:hypothetical protein